MTTNLVVADETRTEKTICLAVTPALKSFGVPGRARLFEVIQKVQEVNARRLIHAPGARFAGKSSDLTVLQRDPSMAVDFIIAPPRMAGYIDYSRRIYEIYLRYAAPEDIHVYSIDEVFIDATAYLSARGMTAREFAGAIIREVYRVTGVTAAAGVGTNLYLCKVAMDIMAKKVQPDEYGVRIAELDEISYRRLLWSHRPLTDFWRIGHGYARKLAQHGMYTMGDVARCSMGKPGSAHSEDLLYRLFGVNAELLIDHAWGWESCTMADIKAFTPQSSSLGSGQVLHCGYTHDKARLIVREMTDQLVLDLVDKALLTDQLVLTIGYDAENLTDPAIRSAYKGPVSTDYYGRKVPCHAHGSVNLPRLTSSGRIITEAVMELFDRITDPLLLVHRVNVAAGRVVPESEAASPSFEQLDLFTDYEEARRTQEHEQAELDKERRRQQAVLEIRKRFGKNAILRGMNLEEGATTMDRNNQIGGHKA